MPKTTVQRTPRATSGWSPERRANHAAAIRCWKPWEKSTGPRTAAGKARAAQNAAKAPNPLKAMDRALSAQARYVTDIKRYIALKKNPHKNELLKRHTRHLHKTLLARGPVVTARLVEALTHDILCKKLAESQDFTVKVNTKPSVSRTRGTAAGLTMTAKNDNRHT